MDITDRLLASEEPSIRYKVRVKVLGEPEESRSVLHLKEEIRRSPRVGTLLADRDERGRIRPVHHVYKKWMGAHWVIASLADIGYPEGDPELTPVLDQVFGCWLNSNPPIVNGRARRCASQQSNALFSAVRLGFIDERCKQLADDLIRWQWRDGGWNCDIRPEAGTSSFWESLIPLRALAAYSRKTGDAAAMSAAERASELFLKRRLFRRLSNGEIMNPQFLELHYPCYWRYDILFALKVMAEAGFISDPRCQDALDLLESKRLPDGGWPAEAKFYSTAGKNVSGSDRVSWGGTSKTRANEWVTADALYVLKAARRCRQ